VRDFDVDPAPILAEAGLSAALLRDPDNVMPFAALGRLLAAAAAKTKCNHFGLLVGQKAGPSTIGLIGFAARHAPDVRSALKLLTRHLAQHDRGAMATLAEEGAVATLAYRIFHPTMPGSEHIAAGALAIIFQMMKILCGPHWQPLETNFAFRRPRDVNPYLGHFGNSVRFDARESSLSFASPWLDSKIIGADPALRRVLTRVIDEKEGSSERNLVDEVRAVIAGMIGGGEVNQRAIAQSFGLSCRTLHRRLAELGTSFRDLLDEVRCDMACRILESTALPVSQVALMLGYSEGSAFTRSFKRRLSCGPDAWRFEKKRRLTRQRP